MRILILLALIGLSTASFAKENEDVKEENKQLPPAHRYSGSTAIELNNGLIMNNGTFGAPNPEYEKQALVKKIVPGINDAPYAYEDKDRLLRNLDEQVMWGETAIDNWKNNTSKKPEVTAYAKSAVETMSPYLDKLKSATSDAHGAGQGDWASKEEGARKALSDFRSAYRGLHHNVATH